MIRRLSLLFCVFAIAACNADKPLINTELKTFLSTKICTCYVDKEQRAQGGMDAYYGCFDSVFAENEARAIELSGKTMAEMQDGTYWREAGLQVGLHAAATCPSIGKLLKGGKQ